MSNHLSEVASAIVIPKTTGSAASSKMVAEGTHVSALTAGEYGVFSSLDNLAVDATPASPVREFYIAYRDSNGKTWRSAGQKIDQDGVTAYTGQCYTPARQKIIDVDLGTLCKHNTQLFVQLDVEAQYFNYGFSPVRIPIVAEAACCDTCDCTDVDCKDVAVQYRDAINAHPDGLLEAGLITQTEAAKADPTSPFLADNDIASHDVDANGCLILRVRGLQGPIAEYCGIPRMYQSSYATNFEIYPGSNTSCNFTTTVIQEALDEQMGSHDVNWDQYVNGYWEGNIATPYRLTESGVPLTKGEGKVAAGGKYQRLSISYVNTVHSGWGTYKNPHRTDIYFELDDEASTDAHTETAALVPVLDAILGSRFGALAGFFADCATDGSYATALDPDGDGSEGPEGPGIG